MHLTRLEIAGFKSFAKKTTFDFSVPVVSIVGPNGSGKSNVAEGIRFVLGEQSMKSMRTKRGEDLIWNGSNGTPRANRASASLTFNNSSRFLDIDFDEVVVERIVHRDGANEYRLNGSTVRLKDIVELLARANIGQTGHHIISQGEADKILAASPRERREMLEDALGLKVFQYKKDESVRKLEKTEENVRQVEALRREVHPHLRFLKRQVEKIQKTEELRNEAQGRFREYLQREDAYVRHMRAHLEERMEKVTSELAAVTEKIKEARAVLAQTGDSSDTARIVALSEEVERVREERRGVLKESARLSGQLDALAHIAPEASVQRDVLERFIIERENDFAHRQTTREELVQFVKGIFSSLRGLISGTSDDAVNRADLQKQKQDADEKERVCAEKEQSLTEELDGMRDDIEKTRTQEREKERALFALTAHERELQHTAERVRGETDRLLLEEEEYTRERAEAGALIGQAAVAFREAPYVSAPREEAAQEKRELQKIKIRLEEMGGAGGTDILQEYQDASEREAFLEKELHDLTQSAERLRLLIAELNEELRTRFTAGIGAINVEFSRFFSLMFDGGTASLVFIKEPVRKIKSFDETDLSDDEGSEHKDAEEKERFVDGIDISLSIPRKRIKSLVMLSGGERALTSIALIFAMSSVNPPPFLVLDETDAALDEANSRRYGDMIEALSEKSQLILITHNRETMSRAGILYGVTMGGDGVSKILSIKLEEAVQVAK